MIALGAFGTAFTAMLLIFGALFVGQMLHAVWAHEGGVIGGWIGEHVQAAFDAAMGWVRQTFDRAVEPIAVFVSAIVHLWTGIWSEAADLGAKAIEVGDAIVSVGLVKLKDWAVGEIRVLADDADNALTDIRAVISGTAQQITDVRKYAAALAAAAVGRAVALARADIDPIVNEVKEDLTAAESELSGRVGQAVRDAERYASDVAASAAGSVAASLTKAEGELTGEVDAAVHTAETAAAAALATAATAIPGALDHDAREAIAAGWGDVQAAMGRAAAAAEGMAGRLPGLIESVPGAVPATVAAAVGALARAVATTSEATADCTIPNCRNLSGFGRDLKGLLDDLGEGGLIALFVELGVNPTATAEFAEKPLTAMVDGMTGTVSALAGV